MIEIIDTHNWVCSTLLLQTNWVHTKLVCGLFFLTTIRSDFHPFVQTFSPLLPTFKSISSTLLRTSAFLFLLLYLCSTSSFVFAASHPRAHEGPRNLSYLFPFHSWWKKYQYFPPFVTFIHYPSFFVCLSICLHIKSPFSTLFVDAFTIAVFHPTSIANHSDIFSATIRCAYRHTSLKNPVGFAQDFPSVVTNKVFPMFLWLRRQIIWGHFWFLGL